MNVFMQMSQSGEIVSKSTFVCAQKGQRGPKGVFFFFKKLKSAAVSLPEQVPKTEDVRK